jgi:uncharacterized protein
MNNRSPVFCPVIIVMAKVPRKGKVKTRLNPFLIDEQTESLATCFLQDTISNAVQITSNIIVAYTPRNGRKRLIELLPPNLNLFEQKGSDLTEKLESVIEYAESLSFNPIIIIGADSPTLPPDYIQIAIESFRSDETDIALGGTKDGGFYLIGLRKKHSGLFDSVAWSSDSVYRQIAANVERLGLNLFSLRHWYDVDTPDDLIFLRDEILNDKQMQHRAPQTFQWIIDQNRLLATGDSGFDAADIIY